MYRFILMPSLYTPVYQSNTKPKVLIEKIKMLDLDIQKSRLIYLFQHRYFLRLFPSILIFNSGFGTVSSVKTGLVPDITLMNDFPSYFEENNYQT